MKCNSSKSSIYSSIFSNRELMVVFITSLVFIGSLELEYFINCNYCYPFQLWTSDQMMQTLTISELQKDKFSNLWYLHKQPPLLDFIRIIVISLGEFINATNLAEFTDRTLYVLWAFTFASLVMIVLVWVGESLDSRRIGLAIAIVWLFNPGALHMAVMLEGTMLSSLLTTLLLFELWRFSNDKGSDVRIILICISLFLLRSVYQWYFIIPLILSLYIAGTATKRIVKIVGFISIIIFLYSAKQFLLFNTISTATFGGQHKLGIIWYKPDSGELSREMDKAKQLINYPENAKKFKDKFNTEHQLLTHIASENIFKQRLACCLQESLSGILRSIKLNLEHFLEPTSRYPIANKNSNPFGDQQSWTEVLEKIFSGWLMIAVLAVVLLLYLIRFVGNYSSYRRRSLAPAIMFSYIFLILLLSNRYHWAEAERLKFFLEPTIFVFIVTQLVIFFREKVEPKKISK